VYEIRRSKLLTIDDVDFGDQDFESSRFVPPPSSNMRPTAILRQTISPHSKEGYQKALAAAEALVRRGDPEAIYASYFFPEHLRPAYFALKAFNVELAGLQDQVSNQLVGRMRYQWWKDAIKGVYDVSLLSLEPPFSGDGSIELIQYRRSSAEQTFATSLDDTSREFASTKSTLAIPLRTAHQCPRSTLPQPDVQLAARPSRLQFGDSSFTPLPPLASDRSRFS
jgi:hypothetical protein